MTTRFSVLVLVALSAGCTVSKKEKPPPPRAFASDTLPVDAVERSGEICNRLVAAGVAKNCINAKEQAPSKLHGAVFVPSSFEIVGGFPREKCTAIVYSDDKFYQDTRINYADIPADDFPRTEVTSTAAAMWRAGVSCDRGNDDKWDKCRGKKSVAQCAKAFPAEYATHKALHDVAVRIVDGLK